MKIGGKPMIDKLEERPIEKFLNSEFDVGKKISDIISSLQPDRALIADKKEIHKTATNKDICTNLQTYFIDHKQPIRVEKLDNEEIRVRRSPEKPNLPKVQLSSLTKYGLLKEGQVLIFCNRSPRKSYLAERVIVEGDRLRYKDGIEYPSQLATIIRLKHHLIKSTTRNPQSQGPIFFRTEDGMHLSKLMDKFRRML